MDLLQLLPLNDSGADPSPYSLLSSLALNPIYLSLKELPYLENFSSLQKKLENFSLFNSEKTVNYSKILQLKTKWLYEYYTNTLDLFAKDPDYHRFIKTADWLEEYALFKAIKKKQNDQNFL